MWLALALMNSAKPPSTVQPVTCCFEQSVSRPQQTEFAFAARPMQPRHADAVADVEPGNAFTDRSDSSRDFVSERQGQFRYWSEQVPLAHRQMQIRMADAAGRDLDQYFAGAGRRRRDFLDS